MAETRAAVVACRYMSERSQTLGKPERPLRVAIVGAGPAGFYAADFLLRGKASGETLVTEVDLFERLPTPYGLVRSGVAPDHQSIKKVTKAFDKIAEHERFRFFGHVQVGKDIQHGELLEHYDQVLYAVGSATDRRLGIAGEDLVGSHPATAFVGWYNGHPDYRHLQFDLSAKRAIVVGLGNVAMDVTRILARDPEELAETDIASYALAALRKSQVEEVVLVGRRGAKEAAFTPRELKDIAELPGVTVQVDGGAHSVGSSDGLSGSAKQNVDFMLELSGAAAKPARRRVRLRFLCSPVELLGEGGHVRQVKVEANELVETPEGKTRARGTGRFETLEAGLVFRSIGYKGTALPGVPFDERAGTIPNREGRVLSSPGGQVVDNLYTVGWIKRGPSGLIGTNKSDAKETADCMLNDALRAETAKRLPKAGSVLELLSARKVRVVDLAAWKRLDALETARGTQLGKVREKFYDANDMLDALAGS
jgi:ferredoxin--NADP+ reductase